MPVKLCAASILAMVKLLVGGVATMAVAVDKPDKSIRMVFVASELFFIRAVLSGKGWLLPPIEDCKTFFTELSAEFHTRTESDDEPVFNPPNNKLSIIFVGPFISKDLLRIIVEFVPAVSFSMTVFQWSRMV